MTMMAQDVIHNPKTKQSRIARALLACNGDLLLVKEKVNLARAKANEDPITEVEIIEAFLQEASSSNDIQDNIKALLMLNFLQILTDCKSHLQSAMADATYSDLIRTIQMVITGMAQLMPQQPQAQTNVQVDLLQQFGAGQAKERVIARLETYAKVDEKYGADSDTA
jgi:hypothetical protein